MPDTPTRAERRWSLVDALRSNTQADMDGTLCKVSRQAVEEAADFIARALLGSEWRPIETAPKDGTRFDVWQAGVRIVNVYWSAEQSGWCVDGAYGPEEPTPLMVFPRVTHWRPLPAPPSPDLPLDVAHQLRDAAETFLDEMAGERSDGSR